MSATAKPLTLRQQYEINTREQSLRHFARHEIVQRSAEGCLGRWLLKEPRQDGHTGIFWIEIVELRGGHLIVHGDIKAVVFAMYPTSNQVVGSLACWMGRRPSPADGYLREKANHGTQVEQTRRYDRDVAAEDARAWLAERRKEEAEEVDADSEGEVSDEAGDEKEDEFAESFDYVLSQLPDLGPDGAASAWYDIIHDYEVWEHWGWVTCPNFANAWGALVRLVELLDAERAQAAGQVEAAQ